MTEYLTTKTVNSLPRLPLEGSIDLTYRCNNNCRHCWLWIPANFPEKEKELSFEEIKRIVDEARSMGCRKWNISGGEPMLRPDFPEIFDFITRNSASYTINTNGTLITPKIARLMKRKGSKMIALYGATADVHDHITRTPGSYQALMQGLASLKEAGAGFTVQIVPMKDNYHQLQEMKKLAGSLSPYWRIGAAWLHLSSCGDPEKDKEIKRQRLGPRHVVELDEPDLAFEEWAKSQNANRDRPCGRDDRLYASCIESRRQFYINPYGMMSFCSRVKDPRLSFDLRKRNFKQGWEKFIPSLSSRVRGGKEYDRNCRSCDLREDCLWCPVYGYLEHGRHGAKVDYLCSVAKENRKFKENWDKRHRRYYQIAGVTIQVDSDLPITNATFHPKFKDFEVRKPGLDVVMLRHHFFLLELVEKDQGQRFYARAPWEIYRKGNSWIYRLAHSTGRRKQIDRVAVFNEQHNRGTIFSSDETLFRKGGVTSLSMLLTDQVFLSRVLADRMGCIVHSSGVILNRKGLLFVGHSDAGKSTMIKLLKNKARILCDDRVAIRKWPEGFKIHGTWSHGEIQEVSSKSAPLKAIFFLKKAKKNRIVRLEKKKEILQGLLACIIKPVVTADWWEKTLSLVEQIVREVPCYRLHFEKDDSVADLLREL
jgi:MoaA/NifB/PqqE/SkfB family radical SAM enzyme